MYMDIFRIYLFENRNPEYSFYESSYINFIICVNEFLYIHCGERRERGRELQRDLILSNDIHNSITCHL